MKSPFFTFVLCVAGAAMSVALLTLGIRRDLAAQKAKLAAMREATANPPVSTSTNFGIAPSAGTLFATPAIDPFGTTIAYSGHVAIEINLQGTITFYDARQQWTMRVDSSGHLTMAPWVTPKAAARSFAEALAAVRDVSGKRKDCEDRP